MGVIWAGIKEVRLRWGMGNISKDKLLAEAKWSSGQTGLNSKNLSHADLYLEASDTHTKKF